MTDKPITRGSVRGQLLACLIGRRLRLQHIQRLRLIDVVKDVNADYMEATDTIPCSTCRAIAVDDALRESIENYVNAAPHGRPYMDYRPNVGQHLFPSPRTGRGISRRSLARMRPALMEMWVAGGEGISREGGTPDVFDQGGSSDEGEEDDDEDEGGSADDEGAESFFDSGDEGGEDQMIA